MNHHYIKQNGLTLLTPSWPQIPNVHGFSTTRIGGGSAPPFDSLNLGLSTEDDPKIVAQNREALKEAIGLKRAPYWLIQTHSNIAIEADHNYRQQEADASFTTEKSIISAVMTADCLPLLIAEKSGRGVASIHAGWRSLVSGVIENTLTALKEQLIEKGIDSPSFQVWLAPAISQKHFEVGPEVREVFLKEGNLDEPTANAFTPSERTNHYYADLYALARIRLARVGVAMEDIYGGDRCTFEEEEYFFSYRRDGLKSGRMATLIWMS